MFWQTTRHRIALQQPLVMGIVNATPDSFSDGGLHADAPSAQAHCDRLVAEGRSGVMAGAGHYDWNAPPAELFAERDRRLLALKRALRGIGTMAGQGRKA